MTTLRCTRKLLDRLAVPADAASDARPAAPLGDWYANLIRVGHDQLVVAMSDRSFLTLVFPARDARHSLPREFMRALRMLLEELAVPEPVIEREIAAMQPIAYARTESKSLVANMNERARMVELLWRDGLAPLEIMARLATMLAPAAAWKHDDDPARAARRLLGLDPLPPPPATVIQLHVALEGLSPPIWRRLVVPAGIALPRLHRAFQLAMGWEDRHLHEFEIGGARYGTPDPDYPTPGLQSEAGVRLADALAAGSVGRFRYWYDFGDDWFHEVRIESIGPNHRAIRGVVCLEGANRCPPEDVGGPPGYMEALQAMRDPSHPGHRQTLDWLGKGHLDPAEFSMDRVNFKLRSWSASFRPRSA